MNTLFIVLENFRANPDILDRLQRRFDKVVFARSRETAMTEALENAESTVAIIVGIKESFSEELLQQFPRLMVVGTLSTGVDHLDLPLFEAQRIKVVTATGANAVSVAEHALAMILALVKRLSTCDSASRSGMDRAALDDRPPRNLSGKSVGIIGAGATAAALLRLLEPFGCICQGWTLHPEKHQELPIKFTTLSNLFQTSNVVSVHLPLAPNTKGIVNGALLEMLPQGACLVNVARGDLFDYSSVMAVLEHRPDISIAVDEFGLASTPLTKLPTEQCLFSPHLAGVSVEGIRAMQLCLVEGMEDALKQN